MPVERKDPDRVRLMDAFLKEQQAFALLFRLGVLGREEWREWLRQEYNIPLAPPIAMEDGVPSMLDIEGLDEHVARVVDHRMTQIFYEAEAESPEALIQGEQGVNGGQGEDADVSGELTDEQLERLAEES